MTPSLPNSGTVRLRLLEYKQEDTVHKVDEGSNDHVESECNDLGRICTDPAVFMADGASKKRKMKMLKQKEEEAGSIHQA
jgi:hypothetical protein